MSDDMIVVSDLGKVFEKRRLFRAPDRFDAVSDVSFTVRRGDTLGIVGESGSGKSTLLRMLMCLSRPSAGSIAVDGQLTASLEGAGLARFRRTVQPVFQNPASSFNPRQTIGRILRAPLEVHRIGDRRARAARVVEVLERVGLTADHAARYPHQLSGGQKQRVAIARAVILEPAVILADEPTSALDVSVQAQVLEIFQKTKRELGLTSVFVSHNLAVIRQVSDHVAVMRRGKIIESGTAQAVFSNPVHDYTRALLAAVPDHATALARRIRQKERPS